MENYVGRQVPTAMVARNLERGSGFLRPQLDTAPYPNYFLVEPPVYQCAVLALRRASGWPLARSGRIVSALGTMLGAWGLFGLVRRREGSRVALIGVAAYALFPLTIRYGRAFQPDALMLGTLLAGLRCWDDRRAPGDPIRLVVGWVLLAVAIALKVTAAFALVPLVLAILRPGEAWDVGRRGRRVSVEIVLALGILLPAALWYVHAWRLLHAGGSGASADNGAIWLKVLIPVALARAETYHHTVRFLVIRAFTPLGFALAGWGLWELRRGDRFWKLWGISAALVLLMLAGKLHHEYYWLALAPLAAVGVGRALTEILASRGVVWAGALAAGLCGLSILQSASTWRTPGEWSGLGEAAGQVNARVSRGDLLVAPEALLFAADRRGCRLEAGERAAARAAGEWGGRIDAVDPLALVELYQARGARYLADVTTVDDPARLALHEAVRRRYNVLVDRHGVLIAALGDPEDALHALR